MKKVLIFGLMAISSIINAQQNFYNLFGDLMEFSDTSGTIRYWSPSGPFYDLVKFKENKYIQFKTIAPVRFDQIVTLKAKNPTVLLTRDSNGEIEAVHKDSLKVKWSSIQEAPAFVQTNRTLTINGVSQDLSSNRSWSVGDISSSISYSNPLWLTSLAQTKITYSGTSGQYVEGNGSIRDTAKYDSRLNSKVSTLMTPTTPSRAISTTGSNNTYTISTTKGAWVSYTVNFSVALIAALSNGVVNLDYSTNGGANWTTVSSASQVYGVAITITTNQNQVVAGYIPANALVRLNRAQNTNVTITLVNQQEVY